MSGATNAATTAGTATADGTGPCPCGTGRKLEECCGPYLDRKAPPPTAEALMRSRYSAFALGRVEYILETHHSKSKEEVSAEAIREWCKRAEWLGFQLVSKEGGGEKDEAGDVHFIARYREKGVIVNHDELARFEKEDGVWKFVTGATPPARRQEAKVGRNDPCPCGSGKKYKKCCGVGSAA